MEIKIEEIKIEDIQKICRICLGEFEEMVNLYESDNVQQMSVAALLRNCMALQVEENEEWPHLVCAQCEAEVLQICAFRLKYDKSTRILQEYWINLEEECVQIEQTTAVQPEEEVPDESVKYSLQILQGVDIDLDIDSNVIEFVEAAESDSETTPKQTAKTISKRKTVEAIFRCRKCNETFDSKLLLIEHRRKFLHYTRKTKTVTCPQCKRLVPVQNYKSHCLKHSANFKCELCGRVFSNNFNLKRHLNLHTKQTPYACQLCDAKFARRDKLKVHLMIHTGEMPFICDCCGQQFQRRDKLKCHLEKVALCNSNDSDNCEKKYKRTLSCNVCSKAFALMSSLRTHKLLHTDERVICSDCGKFYPNEKKLNDHRLQVHCKKITNDKEFLCNICAKQYCSNAVLQRHLLSHMGLAKMFKCETCNKAFTQSGSLALHMKIHTGEKPFVCHICSRAFNKPSNLQRHIQTHDNVRPHLCAICGKSFSVKHSLIVHTRLHTGEKPFSCSVCSKKFVDGGSLKKHFRIHSDHT